MKISFFEGGVEKHTLPALEGLKCDQTCLINNSWYKNQYPSTRIVVCDIFMDFQLQTIANLDHFNRVLFDF